MEAQAAGLCIWPSSTPIGGQRAGLPDEAVKATLREELGKLLDHYSPGRPVACGDGRHTSAAPATGFLDLMRTHAPSFAPKAAPAQARGQCLISDWGDVVHQLLSQEQALDMHLGVLPVPDDAGVDDGGADIIRCHRHR